MCRDVVYTVGHSDHPPEVLVKLLAEAGIEILVDVRSHPSSRWVTHANPRDLKRVLNTAGIEYVFLGDALGGRPDLPDQVGTPIRAKYESIQRSQAFQQGLDRLFEALRKSKVCIMCAEEDPSSCHRNLLVGDALRLRGVQVLHIRGTGLIQTDKDLRKEKAGVPPNQLELPLGDGL